MHENADEGDRDREAQFIAKPATAAAVQKRVIILSTVAAAWYLDLIGWRWKKFSVLC